MGLAPPNGMHVRVTAMNLGVNIGQVPHYPAAPATEVEDSTEVGELASVSGRHLPDELRSSPPEAKEYFQVIASGDKKPQARGRKWPSGVRSLAGIRRKRELVKESSQFVIL